MIFDFVVGLFSGFATVLTGFLPAGSGPFGTLDVHGLVVNYTWLNTFLPVSETLDLLVLIVQVLSGLAAFWIALWAVKKIPFLGIH